MSRTTTCSADAWLASGLGPKVLRRRPDGDDLDIEALIDLFVDLRSGFSAPEHIYLERRKLARNLGVLILLDASGSATDADPDGLSVHDHQRRAAATLAVTLEELGDRVAVYAFRSHGRSRCPPAGHQDVRADVSAPSDEPGSTNSNQRATRASAPASAVPARFSRPRPAPRIACCSSSRTASPTTTATKPATRKPTPSKALEELRTDGVACLCLSIGASTPTDALDRVFGSASHASAPTLADFSPRMDELFLAALQELAAPKLPSRGSSH